MTRLVFGRKLFFKLNDKIDDRILEPQPNYDYYFVWDNTLNLIVYLNNYIHQ